MLSEAGSSQSESYRPQETWSVLRTCHYCVTDDTIHVMLFILQGHSLSATICRSTVGDGKIYACPCGTWIYCTS